MDTTDLYADLLGLPPPWEVVNVQVDADEKRVDVQAGHDRETRFPCPLCGVLLAVYDHAPMRGWRHLDSCEFRTFLHAGVPRVCCPRHGVKQVLVPWALPSSRFTVP